MNWEWIVIVILLFGASASKQRCDRGGAGTRGGGGEDDVLRARSGWASAAGDGPRKKTHTWCVESRDAPGTPAQGPQRGWWRREGRPRRRYMMYLIRTPPLAQRLFLPNERDLGPPFSARAGRPCARGAARRGWPRADGPSRGARSVGAAPTRRARPPASFSAGPSTVRRES